ncbi:copper-translocating P-type ATPase [Listeria costaricensis]|uniref:copper-translocating P-type ATPase n=1 Tax=Listeria costaricensis TaxID=2026604 RepID=UPI001F0925DA|nr:copper-translocating P-type ATPase [Listeria costaricensis]
MNHNQNSGTVQRHKEHSPMKQHDHHKQTDRHHEKTGHGGHHDSGDGQMMHHHGDFKKRFFLSLILTLPIFFLSSMTTMLTGIEISFPGADWLLFLLSTIIFFYGGWPFLTGMMTEVKAKNPAMMTLISLAIVVAYLYSTAILFFSSGMNYFWELATLIDIMLLGHWIEMRAVMKAGDALQKMAELLPGDAHLVTEQDEIKDVPLQEIQKGQIVLVKEGEKMPADGRIVRGSTHVNEAMLTGESKAVAKEVGSDVIAGSINGNQAVRVEVTATGEDSYLSQVIKLVSDAQKEKSRTETLSDKAAKLLFYVALAAGIITFIVWFWLSADWSEAINRAVTVLIIACPHALGLAIPLVVARSTSLSAKNGLLIRRRMALEDARLIDTVAFDKTGTLTEGEFKLTDIVVETGTEDELLQIFAALENQMSHPIAISIVQEAKSRALTFQNADQVTAISGVGLEGKVGGATYKIVNTRYLRQHWPNLDLAKADQFAGEGKTVSFLLKENQLIGYVAIADEVRETAKETINGLHKLHKKAMMLTGDSRQVADKVGAILGIDYVEAELLPQDKAKTIQKYQHQKETVMMVGDGVNDSPALATAKVGVAIGAGTDVAMETADVILSKSNPKDVLYLIRLSKETYRKMIQNLWWAAGYNILAIPLAAGVLAPIGLILSPALGAVLMSLSTIIVAINAQLMKVK